MIDLNILDRRGCSPAKLKTVFEDFYKNEGLVRVSSSTSVNAVQTDPKSEKIAELINRIRARIESGRNWNFTTYNTFSAMDLAWNLPFKQITPTLLASLEGKELKEVKDKLTSWGVNPEDVVETTKDEKGGSKSIIHAPAFFRVFVPLVRSMLTIRWAKIVNDRRQIPFLKFEPSFYTKKNRAKAEMITNRIEVMSRQMGYFEVMKQSVFQMLHYGMTLVFPKEQWYQESQETENPEPKPQPVNNPMAQSQPDMVATDEKANEAEGVVVKEGIRYHMPHPSRMYWDQFHRPSTFNTDTGCEFAGYWHVVRYRDISGNSKYWCTDHVGYGMSPWWDTQQAYFASVFNGCVMNWPPVKSEGASQDRETKMNWNLYNNAEYRDMSCTLTEHFEKLIPSQWGLGDYDHPVWFRFVIAGDTATIIYAAPLPYAPVFCYLYDPDENRDVQSSMTLEILPFQDQFSNLMSQYILTIQNNLKRATFVDTDQVDEKDLEKLENAGQKLWTDNVFIRYSAKSKNRGMQDPRMAFQNVQFQPASTQEIVQAMTTILSVLERLLVMSSQEVAQAASHEQTREEVKHIAENTSTRLKFTETPVDLAAEAWKRQIYQALMAYGADEMYAQVAYDKDITKKMLEDLGFTVVEESDSEGGVKMAIVKGSKKSLGKTASPLESFAATREERSSETDAAQMIMQLLSSIISSDYGISLGANQLFEVINHIGRRVGVFDKDFKLTPVFDPSAIMKKRAEMEASGKPAAGQQGGGQQQQPQDGGLTPDILKQIMADLEQRILQQVGESIKPLGEMVMTHEQALKQLGEMLQQIGTATQQIGAATQQTAEQTAQIGAALQETMALSQANAQQIQQLTSAVVGIESAVSTYARSQDPAITGGNPLPPEMGTEPGIPAVPSAGVIEGGQAPV